LKFGNVSFRIGKQWGHTMGDNGDDEKIMCDGEDNMMVMGDGINKKYR